MNSCRGVSRIDWITRLFFTPAATISSSTILFRAVSKALRDCAWADHAARTIDSEQIRKRMFFACMFWLRRWLVKAQ